MTATMPPLPDPPPAPAPPKLDLGELALAVVGVTALIDDDIPKMGKGRQEEALAIPGKAQKLARAILAEDAEHKYEPMSRPGSYRAMLERFKAGLQTGDVQKLVDAFPPEASDMSGSFQLVAQAAFQHMKELFPTTVVTSFLGPSNVTPDDGRVWKFFSQLQVLDNPLRVFNLIETAALLRSQVAAVRTIYPTLSKLFDAAIYEAMGLAKVAKQSYRMPPRTEQGLSTWFGRRIVAHVPPKPAGPPPPAPVPPVGKNPLAAAMATRTQRATEGS